MPGVEPIPKTSDADDQNQSNLSLQQQLQLEMKRKREEINRLKEKKEQQDLKKELEKANRVPTVIPIDEKPKTFAQLMNQAKQAKKDKELIDSLLNSAKKLT